MHFRHRWTVIERIGNVVTEQCAVCPKTRTRVRGPVRDSAAAPIPGYPNRPESGPKSATAARRSIVGDAVPHRTRLPLDEIDNGSPDYHG